MGRGVASGAMATLTSSGTSKGFCVSPSFSTSFDPIRTMCEPLSISAVTGKESGSLDSLHFHRKCPHLSGGGLTEERLSSVDSESSASLLSEKTAATISSIEGDSALWQCGLQRQLRP
jgi:hypothetical protein